MPDRKQFAEVPEIAPEIQETIDESKKTPPSNEDLKEQRISFAYGNAPESKYITKDSVRLSSESIRLTPPGR